MEINEEHYNRLSGLAQVLADLDRCAHGRHAVDQCFSCPGGQSSGNPILRPGQTIGYSLTGSPIVMPLPLDKYNPAAWRKSEQ